jgi:hypothetical protein
MRGQDIPHGLLNLLCACRRGDWQVHSPSIFHCRRCDEVVKLVNDPVTGWWRKAS